MSKPLAYLISTVSLTLLSVLPLFRLLPQDVANNKANKNTAVALIFVFIFLLCFF